MRSVRDIFRSYAVFDSNGRHINGTDKESNHHYGDAYEALFPDRDAVELMLEIGVADGSSILAWREVFPNALCVAMDIHPAAKLYQDSGFWIDRVEFHIGDQRSRENCRFVTAGRLFDFICEDATHDLPNTLLTLLYLWPFVRPGGLYVVEEFANIGALWEDVKELLPLAERVDTVGPSGGTEPLVILRKPL